MQIHYYEVYDNAPYMNDRRDVMFDQTLIGRYQKFGDALALAEEQATELGLNYKTYMEGQKYKDLRCIVGIFFDIRDNEVSYHDEWDYGRFMSVIEFNIDMDVDLREKET